MEDECSWCIAFGHDWETWPDGGWCEMCGAKKPAKQGDSNG